jgi:hypothetical protein
MADSQPPTAPLDLQVSEISQTSLKLSWTASTDNFGLSTYDIYQDGTLVVSVPAVISRIDNTTYTVTGLTPGTTYTFFVKAKDASNNLSSSSNSVSPTTLTDNDPPTALALNGNKVPENVWLDYEIGTFTTTDETAGDTFTYTLVSGEGDNDNSDFTIDGDTLKSAIVFYFSEQETHLIRVRTTDSYGLFFEQMFEVEVTQGNVTLNELTK